MNFIKLFISLSCVSAAFVPKLSRSLAVKFNRLKGQERGDHSEFHAQFSLPQMPSIPNPLPIAFCDSLPKNPVIYEPDSIEILLEKKEFNALFDLQVKCAIDFNDIPKTKDFYRILTDRNCINCEKIMKGYFDSGLIDDMVKLGSISYQDIVDCALENDNFFVANLALDRLIEKHRPELKSPHYKAERPFDLGSEYNLHNLITFNLIDKNYQYDFITALPEDPNSELKRKDFYFNCNHRIYRSEMFKFAKNYYLIFYNHPMEPWMADLRRRDVSLMFIGCNL